MSFVHTVARFVRRWHARLGVAAALLFLVLVMTGVALNHTGDLKLAHTEMRQAWLADWYGLKAPRATTRVASPAVVATDGAWLLDGRVVAGGEGPLVGAVESGNWIALAGPDRLLLLTPAGEPIERIDAVDLPAGPLRRLGVEGHRLAIDAGPGVLVSEDGLDWEPGDAGRVVWSSPLAADAAAQRQVDRQLRPAVSLERVMLDLHSGRLYGRWGPWLVDAAALILLLLAGTGLWMQWRSWSQQRRNPHRGLPHHRKH